MSVACSRSASHTGTSKNRFLPLIVDDPNEPQVRAL
jgi:hypothetical protein